MANYKTCLALALLLAGVAVDSNAQFGGGMGGSGRIGRGKGADGQSGRPVENRSSTVSRQEQLSNQLFDLRMRLLITPEQTPPWEHFYASFVDLAFGTPKGSVAFAELSALQAMQRQLSLAQNRFARTENLLEATQGLYARLSPEQQRTADQWLPKLLPESGNESEPRSWTRDGSR